MLGAEPPAKFKSLLDGKIYKLKRIHQSMILLTEQDNENHQIVTEKSNLKIFYRREAEDEKQSLTGERINGNRNASLTNF